MRYQHIRKDGNDIILSKSVKGSRVPLYCLIAALILVLLSLSSGCSKDEPTKPVKFNPPGVFSGTYYVLRNWQDLDNKDSSLAYVTLDFKANLSFYMKVDSVTTQSDFRPCSVSGTYVFRHDTLTIDYSDLNPYHEVCDPNVGPMGIFEYRVELTTLVFINKGTNYRRFRLFTE